MIRKVSLSIEEGGLKDDNEFKNWIQICIQSSSMSKRIEREVLDRLEQVFANKKELEDHAKIIISKVKMNISRQSAERLVVHEEVLRALKKLPALSKFMEDAKNTESTETFLKNSIYPVCTLSATSCFEVTRCSSCEYKFDPCQQIEEASEDEYWYFFSFKIKS